MLALITHPLILAPAIGTGILALSWAALQFAHYLLKDRRYNRAYNTIQDQLHRNQQERCTTTETRPLPALPNLGGRTAPERIPAAEGHHFSGMARRRGPITQTQRVPGPRAPQAQPRTVAP